MVKFETWVSFGSLAMAAMFVALILSFYNFLIGPQGRGPEVFVDPPSVLLQIVSISGAPSLILAGVVFGLTRNYGAKSPALVLIGGGLVIFLGMLFALTQLTMIDREFKMQGIETVPYIFIVGGLGVTGVGAYLLDKERRRKASARRGDFYGTK